MIHIAITVYLATTAIGAFDYRENSPSSLVPLYQATVDASLPDSVSNPAYLPMIKYPYLHFSGCNPYTLDELYSSTLSAGYGIKGFAIQAVWNRFGFEQYLENIAQVNVGFRPVKYVSLGTGVLYYNLAINTIEVSTMIHQVDGRFSILITPFEWIDLSFQHENIGSLFIKKRRDILFPGWCAGAAVKPIKGLTLLYNLNKTAHGYVNSIAASANVLKYFSIKVGYSRETFTYSAGLTFIYKYIAVSYGLKYHPQLGITHSVGITLAPQEISIDCISYSSMLSRARDMQNMKKIDISTCSFERLCDIPNMDPLHAERIIKYRNTIGPVTRDSMIQIGMSEQEVDRISAHFTSLKASSANNKHVVSAKNYFENRQKSLFKKFLSLGLSSSTALELAELAGSGQKESLIKKINSLSGINQDIKNKIRDICAGSL